MEHPAIIVEGRGDLRDVRQLSVLPLFRRLFLDSILVSIGDDGFSTSVLPMGGEPFVQLCRIYEFVNFDIYNLDSRYSIDIEREQTPTERTPR